MKDKLRKLLEESSVYSEELSAVVTELETVQYELQALQYSTSLNKPTDDQITEEAQLKNRLTYWKRRLDAVQEILRATRQLSEQAIAEEESTVPDLETELKNLSKHLSLTYYL